MVVISFFTVQSGGTLNPLPPNTHTHSTTAPFSDSFDCRRSYSAPPKIEVILPPKNLSELINISLPPKITKSSKNSVPILFLSGVGGLYFRRWVKIRQYLFQ